MEHHWSPFLIEFSPGVGIRYYSLAYLLGVAFTAYWLIKKNSYAKEAIYDYALYGFFAVVIGGRLGQVFFYDPQWIWENPLQIIKIWDGGMSFHGGLLAVVVWTWWYCKKQKWDFWQFADDIAIPACVGLALGKFGNYTNGELYGVVSNVPWCHYFSGVEGCRHPSQLYQMIKNLINAGILLIVSSYYNPPKGSIAAGFLILYGIGRSFIEIFYRQPDWVFWGITSGTWLSIPMILLGSVLLIYRFQNEKLSIENTPKEKSYLD